MGPTVLHEEYKFSAIVIYKHVCWFQYLQINNKNQEMKTQRVEA